MFTGLIADLGHVTSLERDGEGATITVATGLAGEVGEGDSVAVNGVCLTATHVNGGSFVAQAMAETLRRSSLGGLEVGAPVNVELALRADGRLGGHIVQGHVDGTGVVADIREEGFARVLDID
ncbi:MAG TPA: riboflavin synthase, partial [Ktedonobacterales bacterium]